MKKIFNINRYDMFWIVIVGAILAIWGLTSCETVKMGEECTLTTVDPKFHASQIILNPTPEQKIQFTSDWGAYTMTCKSVIISK